MPAEWVVREVLDERRDEDGLVEFLVKWEDTEKKKYSLDKHDSWQPEENLKHSREKVNEFRMKLRRAKANKRQAEQSSRDRSMDPDNEGDQDDRVANKKMRMETNDEGEQSTSETNGGNTRERGNRAHPIGSGTSRAMTADGYMRIKVKHDHAYLKGEKGVVKQLMQRETDKGEKPIFILVFFPKLEKHQWIKYEVVKTHDIQGLLDFYSDQYEKIFDEVEERRRLLARMEEEGVWVELPDL